MAPFSDYEEHENSGEEDSLDESYLGDLACGRLWREWQQEVLVPVRYLKEKKNQRIEMQNENVE